ncbi:MAG: hypothetical protein GX941_01115 [Candidatus Methanofastidiosa archaeon]|jgi:hypothetical protein|nr:hypothetical protein [Syntrophomonadaceae bacterium]NMA30402.1 hypothetical protein [Candidatus Methanofastidiosa archaeon]
MGRELLFNSARGNRRKTQKALMVMHYRIVDYFNTIDVNTVYHLISLTDGGYYIGNA